MPTLGKEWPHSSDRGLPVGTMGKEGTQPWLFWGLWRYTVGCLRNRKDAKDVKILAAIVGAACENRDMKISAGQRRRLSRIAQKYDLRLVLAFGSSVTGQRHPRSDLDIAVRFDHSHSAGVD